LLASGLRAATGALSGTTFSGANVYAVSVTATNLTATNISAGTYVGINLEPFSATNISATNFSATTLTATTISAVNVSATTISATTYLNTPAGGIAFSSVTSTSVSMCGNYGFVLNNAGVCTATLPLTGAVGNVIEIAGVGAGMWKVAQNASQAIHFGNLNSTTGANGYLSATNRYDYVKLICVVADNEYTVAGAQGNIVVV